MKTRTVLPIAALLALSSFTAACRHKAQPAPSRSLDRPATYQSLSMLCSGTKKGFADENGYAKHADGTPSGIAVFAKGEHSFSAADRARDSGYTSLHYDALDGFTHERDAELTVCVDMGDMTEEHGVCSYWGASVKLRGREFHVRVLETKTGAVLSDETYTTSDRTEGCPISVHGSGDIYVSPEKRLLATVAGFEPESSKLPPAKVDDLVAVCTGTGVPQAASGDRGAVDVVFFPSKTTSWSNELPIGMDLGSEAARPTSVQGYSRVLCVTQVPNRLIQSCPFTSGRMLDVYSGEFEAELRDAQTARVIETKRFQSKGSDCPAFHTFKSNRDVLLRGIDPSFRAWVLGLEPSQGGAHNALTIAPSATTTAL